MSTKKTTKTKSTAATVAASVTSGPNRGKVDAGCGPPNNVNLNNNKNCQDQTSERRTSKANNCATSTGTASQSNREKPTEPRPSKNERLAGGSRPPINTAASVAVPSQDHNSNRERSGGGGGSGGGSGPPSNFKRFTTDSSQGQNSNRVPEQPANANSNDNKNWRQMNSKKYNSNPWQNGPQAKSAHFNNNNRDWRQNQSRNCLPCGRSYQSNNLTNFINNYRQSSNYHSSRNWQPDRYYQRRTNFRHNTISDDCRTRLSEASHQNSYNDHRSNSKSNWDKQKETNKELEDKSVYQKEEQDVKQLKPSQLTETPAKSRRKSLQESTVKTTSSQKSTEVSSAQKKSNEKSLEKTPEENRSESCDKSKDKTNSNETYPKIQVRPLTELLEPNKTGDITKENRPVENSSPTPTKLPIRPAFKIPRRSTISNCRDNVVSFNDQLARMDKESLKYIINNSDTIFEEQLQIQARQRICEQISRRLKGIELKKPKDNPVSELIEDDIVDATKLPALFLQEIENCFGLDIFSNQKNHQNKEKENLLQSEELIERKIDTEKSVEEFKNTTETTTEAKTVRTENSKKTKVSPEKEKDQLVQTSTKEVESPKTKRKISEEVQQVEEPIKKPKETHKTNEKSKENAQKSSNKPVEPVTMAKKQSSDLKARLKVAEEFKNLTEEKLNTDLLLKNANKRDKKSPQKNKTTAIEIVKCADLDSLELEIKEELVFCPTTSVTTVVISSSDEDDDDYDEEDDSDNNNDDKDGENDDGNISDCSNTSSSSSSYTKRHYNGKLQCGVVIDTFEKLILPHLQQESVERYRNKNSTTLYPRLQFIFDVVTSSKHNPQVFSKTEINKIQKNLKESNNRIAVEFLLKEIVNVAAAQRGKEEQRVPNGITGTKNAEPTEVSHQRNPVDVSPTPPPPASQNAPLSMQCLRQQPFNLPSSMQLQFGLESNMPRLQLGSCYSLLANGETSSEPCYGQDTITQSILEIDRRLLEYQNRRTFIDEIIMKFQKEKSDLELLTLELHSRKFLILNTVLTKNQAGSTPSQANTTPTVTPTNSPCPDLESIATEVSLPSPPVASKSSKEANRRRKASQKARKKLRKENEQEEGESTISIPRPMGAIKEDPETEETSLALNSHPPVKKLRITKSNLPQQQQPLAIIPPLPPPPPPPEPIVNGISTLPPLPPPPTLPESIANMSYSLPNRTRGEARNSEFDDVPSGRLHSISYPITHIRIYKIYIIASSEDGDIYMFNIKNHKLERQITKHSEAITNMFLCEKDSYLYTTSLDGFLKKSSLENLERVMQTVYFKEPLQSIDLAWGLAFIGSRWGNLFTFDVMTNKVMESPLLSTGQSIIAVKASKEGPRKIVILGCKGNFVYMHDATTGLLLRRLTLPNDLNVYSLLLNDGHVYCGTQKNEIYKFDFASGSLVNKVSCGNGAVSMVAYGDRYLLAGCYDGFIYVLDKLRCTQTGRFEGAGRMVLALAIVGDKIVTSSKDKSLVVLEIPLQMITTEH